MPPMHPRHHRRDKKEDNIHDSHRKASLEHPAGLVKVNADNQPPVLSQNRPRGAICVGDPTEVVHARDERAKEAEVDEPDELGVVGGAVVEEKSKNCPGEGEDGDDEEDEDGGWGHEVGGEVDVDEVGEHADDGDLEGIVSTEKGCMYGRRTGGRGAYEGQYLHEAPKGEHDCEEHFGDLCFRSGSCLSLSCTYDVLRDKRPLYVSPLERNSGSSLCVCVCVSRKPDPTNREGSGAESVFLFTSRSFERCAGTRWTIKQPYSDVCVAAWIETARWEEE